ncbi:uncharacterized protein LOC126846198 [Adelges cooleyi]|uniref:uncharacterized protein LOC126846198 n=1 Tax=Adelges cooleyi TaxID=133065 RepID=UPI00217F8353|nr:uncharacterized protein LOC126846198 [Adelges cooleyi]
MENDKILESALEIEQRFIAFYEFRKDIIKSSDISSYNVQNKKQKLQQLRIELNKLYEKQMQLDKLNMPDTDLISSMNDNIKYYIFLKVHLDTLNQRKWLLSQHTLEEVLDLEEDTLKRKLDEVSEFFLVNLSEIDDEIKNEQIIRTQLHEIQSKKLKKMTNEYQSAIKKLKIEHILMERQLKAYNYIS